MKNFIKNHYTSILIIIQLVLICICTLIAAASFAQEGIWPGVPIKDEIVKVGKYDIVTKIQEITWREGDALAVKMQKLNTEEAYVIDNIYLYFNGAVVKANKSTETKVSFVIKVRSYKISDEIDAFLVAEDRTLPYTHVLDLNNPDVEKFVNTLYDTNNDGILDKGEMVNGNKKFNSYKQNLFASVPADEQFHLFRINEKLPIDQLKN